MEILKDTIDAIRRRPAMYCGGVDEDGLHHLVYFFLDAAFEEACVGECSDVVLEAGGDGSIVLFSTSRTVPAAKMVSVATGDGSFVQRSPYGWQWSNLLVVALGLSSRYQIDMWADGRQWRLLGANGRPLGDVSEIGPIEPMPVSAERGTRIHLVPDATIFEVLAFDTARLARRCNELAALAPGLRVAFADVQRGERTLWHLPGGVAQWVDVLTKAQPRLHPEPVVFEFMWRGLRVQCALQWCEGEETSLSSFANTVRAVRHDVHVRGVTKALRGALAMLAEESRSAFPWERVALGLTAIVAVSPRGLMAFEGPTKTLLSNQGMEEVIRKQLTPRLVEQLRHHPVTPKLLERRTSSAR